MLRAILFDLGDTLIDFEPMDTRAVFRKGAADSYAYLKGLGHGVPAFDVYCRKQFRAVRWAYVWAKLRRREFEGLQLLRSFCAAIGIHLDEPALLELAWLWYAPLIDHSGVEENLAVTLADLRDAGFKLGLVSNTFVASAIHDRHLALHGLLDLLPIRVYSSDIGYRKPDRRIFQSAIDRLGVGAAETLFVGDLVKTDIVGAHSMGMKTALKQPWGTSRSHGNADVMIRRLSELPEVLAGLESGGPLDNQTASPLAMTFVRARNIVRNAGR